MDLRHIKHNFAVLLSLSVEKRLDADRHGKLLPLTTKWEKRLFSAKNLLLLGAPAQHVEQAVYYTLAVSTLELNNPFDKGVLKCFLTRKIALLNRLLQRIETLNGRKWEQRLIKLHIDVFHRKSLIQYEVIRKMHAAVRRQKKPKVLQEAKEGLKKGLYPILITEGCSGAYWMRDSQRRVVGLFKPFDEEIHAPNNPVGPALQGALGQRRTRLGCRVGEAAHHEVAAFLVDAYFGFGIVPLTYYAEFTHRTFFLARENRLSSYRPEKKKYGSFQEFLEGFVSLDNVMGERDQIPLVEFQLLVILDVIIGNTDRNTGNILVGKEKLAAIDHGLCFPDQNHGLSYWYWKLAPGKEPLIQSLIDLLDSFPFEGLFWKLKKQCYLTVNALNRIRERVVLFRTAIHAGLMPNQIVDLMQPEYLYPLKNYTDRLPQKAQEQVDCYSQSISDSKL